MVTVIVLNYNDMELTEKYVLQISKYGCIDHVVIVDNCSPDNSYECLKKIKNEKITVIKTESNKGYAFGNNFGIRYAVEHFGDKGIVIISNPDIEIEEGSLVKILNSFVENNNIFAATGQVYTLSGDRIPLFTWKVPSVGMVFLENSVVLRILFRKIFKYNRRYSDEKRIDIGNYYFGEALPGCFFAADISKFLSIDLFCEKTFLYFEEDILFFKAKKKGYRSIVVKDSSLVHAEGTTTRKNIASWKKRERIAANSAVVFMRECYGVSNFVCSLYGWLNTLFMPERYMFYLIKTKLNRSRIR